MGLVDDFFVYNGVSSKDFGAVVSGYETFDIPERDEKKVEVAGRNGDLTFDNGRWKNVPIAYKCLIYEDFEKNYDEFANRLAPVHGYHRLEDTIHPDVFRIAKRTGLVQFTMHGDYEASGFSVSFDAKPQKFLKIGERPVTYTASGKIFNPTGYEALPIIRVYSAGTLHIGTSTIVISSVNEYVDIDCDIQDAHKGSINCNSNVSGKFPVLKAGANNIVLDGITRIDITPRWWKL